MSTEVTEKFLKVAYKDGADGTGPTPVSLLSLLGDD